ncbi:MAG: hypothetical protein C0434_12390 [Xanthomonadaceae bacterium]|nr:hypothetical protein [Xanthomonadaceae bacterium]
MTMIRRPSLARALPLAAVTASLAMLAGCNPIGSGTGPTRLVINGPTGEADAATGDTFVCLRSGLTATLFFENGTSADFTQRVNWSVLPADQSFLTISNFDRTTGLAGGVLTPVSATTGEQRVRITASFSGLTDSIDMRVMPKPDFTLVQRNIGTNLNEALPAGSSPTDPTVVSTFKLGPLTSVDLALTANLGGIPTRIDSAANWSFDTDVPGTSVTSVSNAANEVVATINSDGLVTATTVDPRTLTARATFAPCNQSIAVQFSVSPIRSVRLVPEFGAQPLIVPNSERYTVFAGFDESGPEQNVSPFATITSSDTAVANFISAFIGVPNLMSSIAAGGPITLTVTRPAIVTPTPPETTPARHAPTIPQTVVADTLVSVALEPAAVSAVVGSATVCPTRLVGTYSSGAQQDVTRRATFASSDTAIAIVSSLPLTAGQVGSSGITPGTATITATIANGTGTPFTATSSFTSVAPTTTPAPSCPQSFEPLPGQVPAP